MFDSGSWSQEIEVAVRQVEPTVEQDGLGDAPEHKERGLDGGQLAKQFQVVGHGLAYDEHHTVLTAGRARRPRSRSNFRLRGHSRTVAQATLAAGGAVT
jgi:hypothetical protein